jgi:DNA-binding SARP family transcriptional activator
VEAGGGQLRCSVFGGIDVAVGGVPVTLRGRQRRRFVAALLATSPRPVRTAQLVSLLQLDAPSAKQTASPENAVHAHVTRVRALIEPGVASTEARWLRSCPDGYLLEPDSLDLWQYQGAVASAEAMRVSAPLGAIAAYEEAFAMWATPFGDLASDDAVVDAVVELENARLDHQDACTDLRLAAGVGGDVAAEIVAAARAEPLREHRWAQAMQALFQANRQVEALRIYGEVRAVLLGELGLEPGPELRRIEQQVLDQDPQLLGRRRRSLTRGAPATTFVGRNDEIELLGRLIERHTVVTVAGLGGIGKTRLVTEWLARSPLGQVAQWIDLRGVTTDEGARHRIATDLGVGGSGAEPLDPVELAVATLGDEIRLLVIDNAEAALAAVADLVSRSSGDRRDVRFLITSRTPVGLTGETVLSLSALPIPEHDGDVAGTAVELVMDRLGSRADETLARRLAARYGGLPYPLELVAASQGVAAANSSAADPVDGELTADAAVAAAVEVALDHVSDDAIDVLWTTMLLPDGVTAGLLDAAFTSRAPDFARRHRDRVLRELVAASLITTGAGASGVRYRGSEPLAQLGAGRLPVPVAAGRMVAMASWWSTRARSSFFEPPDRAGRVTLHADHRNIVHVLGELEVGHPETCLELAGRMVDHWERSGHTAEGADWVRRASDRVDPDGPLQALATAALVACSGGLAMHAQYQPQLEHSRELLISAGESDGDIWAVVHLQLALARGWNGDLPGSDEAYAEARSQADTAGSDWFGAVVHRYGALRFALSGEPLRGVEQSMEAAQRLESLGDLDSAAGSLYFASVLGRMAGVADLAPVLLRARALADDAGAIHMLALIAVEQGQDARRRSDPTAPEILAEGATLTERTGNLRTGSITRRDLGLYLLELDRRTEATEQLLRAARHLLRLDTRAAALALAGLSVLAEDQPALATELARAAWDCVAQDRGVPLSEGELAQLEALVGRAAGSPPQRDPAAVLADAAAQLVASRRDGPRERTDGAEHEDVALAT